MRIGLLSDSHGASLRLAAAVGMLAARGARTLIHCGDIDDAACLDVLAASGVSVHVTAGNMDRAFSGLEAACAQRGLIFGRRSVELRLDDGRWLAAMHGHDETLVEECIAGGQFAFLCLGHTHRRRDELVRGVRVINPGAIFRAHPPSAALLDTEGDRVEFIDLPA